MSWSTPRLDPHCHVVALDAGALVRRGALGWHVEDRDRAALLLGLAPRLDGRALEDVLAELCVSDKLDALVLLEQLDRAGLLVPDEGGPSERDELELVRITAARSVAISGHPALVDQLGAMLERVGVHVVIGSDDATLPSADLWISILDASDWDRIDALGQLAALRRQAWLPAFVLAGDRLAGPVIVPGRSACVRCLALRWLGMSSAVAMERALFEHLRRGGWRREAGDRVAGDDLVRACATLVVDWLRDHAAPGSMHISLAEGGEPRTAMVYPHPACEACKLATPAPSVERVHEYWQRAEDPPPSLESLARSLAPLCDDRVGLVSEPWTAGEAGASGRHAAHARFALPRPIEVGSSQSNTSCGMASSADSAKAIALIEGLERHCMISSITASRCCPYEHVRADALHPEDLPLYSPAQYDRGKLPFARFDPSANQEWVWVYNLSQRRPVLVPRTAVWSARANEGALLSETSSGVAAHGTRSRALLGGLMELIERDAFMIFWLHRLAPPRIDLDSVPSGFAQDALAELDAAGYRPVLLDATTDLGVPVVLGAATRVDERGPALLFGAGCALDRDDALDSALGELSGALRGVLQRPDWRPSSPYAPEQVRALADHSKAYAHPSWLTKAAFLWSSPIVRPFAAMRSVLPRSVSPASPTDSLACALELLAARRLELLAADLSVPQVAAAGLHVVRAIVPGLQPIGFGPHGVRLGGRRLYAAPVAMGYAGCQSEAELNLDPHCFP